MDVVMLTPLSSHLPLKSTYTDQLVEFDYEPPCSLHTYVADGIRSDWI